MIIEWRGRWERNKENGEKKNAQNNINQENTLEYDFKQEITKTHVFKDNQEDTGI